MSNNCERVVLSRPLAYLGKVGRWVGRWILFAKKKTDLLRDAFEQCEQPMTEIHQFSIQLETEG